MLINLKNEMQDGYAHKKRQIWREKIENEDVYDEEE